MSTNLLPDDLFAATIAPNVSWATDDQHFFGRPRGARRHPSVPKAESVEHFVLNKQWEPQVKFAVKTGKPLLLVGPKGSGKTLFARWLAYQLGLAYYEMAHSNQFEFVDVVTIDVQTEEGRWIKVDGSLITAFSQGGVYCADEMFASRASELQNYHPYLTNDRITIRGRAGHESIVTKHPDFFFVGTANDWKNTLGNFEPGDPLLDRMTIIIADYIDQQTEMKLLQAQTGISAGIAKDLTTFAAKWRDGQRANKDSTRYTISTRKLVDTCNLMRSVGITIEEAVEIEILAVARLKYPEEVETLITQLRAYVSAEIGT